MDKIFEITDKFGNKIRLTNKQYKHIQRHPHLHDPIDVLKLAIMRKMKVLNIFIRNLRKCFLKKDIFLSQLSF